MSSPPVIDVVQVMDRARLSALQKRVIAICFGMALLEGFDSQAMGYAAPSVAREFGLGPGALSLVFSSGLLGMLVGSFLFGFLADRIGRRQVMIWCGLLIGVATLLIAVLGTTVAALAVLRFIAGVGMGGAISTQIAVAAEYTPARVRSTVIMVLVGSLGLGSFLGGLAAAALIPSYGWRSIFVLGGVLPLLLTAWILLRMPDSIRYLVAAGRQPDALRLLAQVAPDSLVGDQPARLVLPEEPAQRSPVATLFTQRRAIGTVLVWIAYFMNLLAVYFLLSWLPVLFEQVGLSQQMAVAATAVFALGGFIGGITLGMLIDRRGHAHRILAVGYLLAAAFAVIASLTANITPVLLIAIFLAGFGVIGCQGGISAAAASMYPTTARGTGVGWAAGIGRFGSILGPTVGGALIAAGLAATSIIASAAVPIVLAAAAVSGLGVATRHAAGHTPDTPPAHPFPTGAAPTPDGAEA
jgi:MFS transporter, AAHS family, 4-hydroxybenzoate transporter